MKRIDIVAKVLAKVSGMPVVKTREMLVMFHHSHPSPWLMEEVPDDEAEELIAQLMTEKQGIQSWLLEGARKAAINPRNVRRIEKNWMNRR